MQIIHWPQPLRSHSHNGHSGLSAFHWERKETKGRKQLNNSRTLSQAGQALWDWRRPEGTHVPWPRCVSGVQGPWGHCGGSSQATPVPPVLQPHGWLQRWLRGVLAHVAKDSGLMAVTAAGPGQEEAWPGIEGSQS